jgi:6-pyruvoyltetrahydropterin/6-carboxytetrahydropterin synthase
VEVTIGGQVNPRTGMICNLVDLDGFVDRNIMERFGHENLNTLPDFKGVVPTTENLCVRIYDILEQDFRHAKVEKVRIEETMLNSFEYAGGRKTHP